MNTAYQLPLEPQEAKRANTTAVRLMAFIRNLSQNYFRAVTIVEDRSLMHSRTPVIFAANHSGMNFPWDCFVLYEELTNRYGERLHIRPLSAPVLLNNPLLSPFALPESWNHFSAPATMKSFEQLMKDGTSVLINPEGIAGIGKGFNKRYQLQPFSSSFIRMCLKYNRPLVPISVVNGEYLNPLAYSSKFINRLVSRLGIPFLPLGPTVLLFAIFPCCAYIALPARLHYVIGRRLDLRTLTNKSYDDLTTSEIRELTAQVQAHMQEHLDKSVQRYGRKPFDLKGLWTSMRQKGWRALEIFPLYWPVLAHRALLGEKPKIHKVALSALLCFALCLPILGWPLLLLILTIVSAARRKSK